jgi:hypothetical protein
VLLAVAALGLVHLLHERRPGWGLLGGALTSLGVISVSSLFVGTSIMQVEMTKGRYDRDQMLSLLHFANNDARFAPFWILSIGLMLGLLVLAVGLYLDRAVPMASAGALAAAAVLLAIAFSASSRVLDIVAFAVLEAGLGSIGAIVLRETDAQWEETPRFEGFHPVMGSH